MGTRADFYVGRGAEAEWLGSIAWDGYPAGIDDAVLLADTVAEYRTKVGDFLDREHGTFPDDGWPWPWDDSRTTDYAYAFEDGKVYASSFGHEWFEVNPAATNGGEPLDDDDEPIGAKTAIFPTMTERKAVTYGKRSGLIMFGGEA